MPNTRIYLGVDINSNLAVSLEPAEPGAFFLIVSSGDRKHDLCRFLCTEDALEAVAQNRAFSVQDAEGRCSILPTADEIVVEFQRTRDAEPSQCTLSLNSFVRVLDLAKARAYVL